jgi:hypothetical protein
LRNRATEHGNRLLRIVAEAPGSVIAWRRALMVLLTAR